MFAPARWRACSFAALWIFFMFFEIWGDVRAKGRGPHPEGDKSGRGHSGPATALLDGVLGSFGPSEFTSTGGKGAQIATARTFRNARL